MENEFYLNEQIITYLGNKRKLLEHIEKEINCILDELKVEQATMCDLFSGSGVVARLLKQYSKRLYVNDLEKYSCIINDCYLTNKEDFNEEFYNECLENILSEYLFSSSFNLVPVVFDTIPCSIALTRLLRLF